MDLGLRERVALVAASSKGIGKAVALGFAQEGAKVAMCARGAEELARAAEEIKRAVDLSEADIFARVADVTQPDQIRALVQEVAAKFSKIDILVNNAGGPPPASFEQLSDEDWQKAFDLNLFSTIRLTREVLPFMKQQKWGRIVNLTSYSVKQPIEGLILSNAVRAGVVGLAKTLAEELAKDNILINNIATGPTLTGRIEQLNRAKAQREHRPYEEVLREAQSEIPLGRYGEPVEIANVVVFLASERASFVTGTTIPVDGGTVKCVM